MIPQTEYIQLESLLHLCPVIFDGRTVPEPGLVFVQPERIKEFFQLCRKYPYVVVSCASDAGLCLQAEHTVNADIMWYADGLTQIRDLPPGETYQGFNVVPRCYPHRCNPKDKYSIKYMQLTESTFNDIPDNIVRWYSCNLRVTGDDRLVCIPFGVSKNIGQLYYTKPEDKSKLLYVNFQEFSHSDRIRLREHYKKQSWVTYVEEAKPFDEYARELSQYAFILSPYGNGVDSYRVWESIYSGGIPVVQKSKWSDHFTDLPILAVNDIFNISYNILAAEIFQDKQKSTLSYWKDRILNDTKQAFRSNKQVCEATNSKWVQTMQAFHGRPNS
jgi:hypothetical protein